MLSETESHPSRKRAPSVAIRALLITIALVGIVSLAASFLPYASFRGWLDGYSGDGTADAYTPEVHRRVSAALFAFSAAVITLAIMGWSLRQRIDRRFQQSLQILRADVSDALRVSRTATRATWLCIAAVVAITISVPLMFMDEPVRYDEAHTYANYASEPLFIAMTKYDAPNNHLLHSVLANISLWLFGDNLVALRLPVWFSTIVAALLTLLAGKLIFRNHVGHVAALVLVSTPTFLESATNARGHMMAGSFLILAVFAFELLRRRPSDIWIQLLLSAAVAGALCTVPTAVYGVALLTLWILLRPLMAKEDKKENAVDYATQVLRPIVALGLAGGLTLLFYGPLLITNQLQDILQVIGGGKSSPYETLQRFPAYLNNCRQWLLWSIPVPIQIVLLVGFIAGFLPLDHLRNGLARLACLLGLVGLIVIHGTLPPERVWIMFLPAFALVTAAGFRNILSLAPIQGQNVATTGVVLVILAVNLSLLGWNQAIHTTARHGTLRNAADVAAWLSTNSVKNRPIAVVTPASAPIIYHFKRNAWNMNHFQVPGSGLTDDSSALVVTMSDDRSNVIDVLAELKMDQLFDPASAVLVKRYDVHDGSVVVIWRITSLGEPKRTNSAFDGDNR